MTKLRKQADTRPATTRSIVASRQFARGFDEGRKPFNSENDSWEYERGRCFASIAPLDMQLRTGSAGDLEVVAGFIRAIADRAHERNRRMSSDEDEGRQALS
jgi:hypothetical protein